MVNKIQMRHQVREKLLEEKSPDLPCTPLLSPPILKYHAPFSFTSNPAFLRIQREATGTQTDPQDES